jgi:homocysteine S-methyltransferase
LVAASIGPYGATLHDGSEYHGNYGLDKADLIDFHRPRMNVLADSDADLFAFETIPSMLEAEALIELLGEFPEHYAWLSFSCRDGTSVSHGELFADCIDLAAQSGQIVGAGLNCTAPEFVSSLLDSIPDKAIPLVVYPNSGEKWNPDGNRWTGEHSHDIPLREWYGKGARVLGGCCRVSTDTIAHMRTELSLITSEAESS